MVISEYEFMNIVEKDGRVSTEDYLALLRKYNFLVAKHNELSRRFRLTWFYKLTDILGGEMNTDNLLRLISITLCVAGAAFILLGLYGGSC